MQKGIAQEVGFLTEDDLAHLYNVSKSKLDNLRGNSFFYPTDGVSTLPMFRVKGFGFTHGGVI